MSYIKNIEPWRWERLFQPATPSRLVLALATAAALWPFVALGLIGLLARHSGAEVPFDLALTGP